MPDQKCLLKDIGTKLPNVSVVTNEEKQLLANIFLEIFLKLDNLLDKCSSMLMERNTVLIEHADEWRKK